MQSSQKVSSLLRSSACGQISVVDDSDSTFVFRSFLTPSLLFHASAWAEVRDDGNTQVDWMIASYESGSKSDITVVAKGNGGASACADALPELEPAFGGCRMSNGRFSGFYYCPEACSAMKKGRASMHKNGVLNVLEGRDGEIKMAPGFNE